MTINFISSKNSKETCITHAKSDNIAVMIGNETDEIIKECFNSLLQRHQQKLEKQMEGSESIFDSIDKLYYKFHRINLNRGGSWIIYRFS